MNERIKKDAQNWLDNQPRCICGHTISAHSGRWNGGPCRILNCWCSRPPSRYTPAESDAAKRERELNRMREEDEKRKKNLHVSLIMATGLSREEAEKEYERMKTLPHDSEGYLLDEEEDE